MSKDPLHFYNQTHQVRTCLRGTVPLSGLIVGGRQAVVDLIRHTGRIVIYLVLGRGGDDASEASWGGYAGDRYWGVGLEGSRV